MAQGKLSSINTLAWSRISPTSCHFCCSELTSVVVINRRIPWLLWRFPIWEILRWESPVTRGIRLLNPVRMQGRTFLLSTWAGHAMSVHISWLSNYFGPCFDEFKGMLMDHMERVWTKIRGELEVKPLVAEGVRIILTCLWKETGNMFWPLAVQWWYWDGILGPDDPASATLLPHVNVGSVEKHSLYLSVINCKSFYFFSQIILLLIKIITGVIKVYCTEYIYYMKIY